MLPKLLGEFGHARGCSGSQNTVVLVEYGGYMVAIRWNMVEYGGIVWQDQYVICDRLSQLLLFGRSFWKGNFLVFPRFWTETRQKWSQRLLVVSCFSYSIPLWDHDYSNQEDSAYRTNMKQQMPQPLFWKKKSLLRCFDFFPRSCMRSLHLPHRGEARLEGHAICGASAAGMKGAEQPQGSNWVIRVFTEHLRIEWNKMEQITILYHTFTIIYPSKSLDLPYIYHDLPLWIHDLRCVLWLKH